MSSRTTGVLSGAPSAFQSGNSSFRARGSNTAPERMCAPTSEPFSTTQTLISLPASAAFCFSRQAADRPAGPAPTMTTSNSMYSRSTGYLLLKAQQVFFSNGWRFGVVLQQRQDPPFSLGGALYLHHWQRPIQTFV